MAKERLRTDDYIKISSEEDYLEIKAIYDRNQRVEQVCSICGKSKKTVLKRVEFPCVCRGCKIKQTNTEKYGNACPCNVGEAKEKARKTMVERYGGVTTGASKVLREKVEKTCMEKYGAKSPLESDEVKDKIKQTCIEKYGVDNPAKDESVIQKGLDTKARVYGDDWGKVIASRSQESFNVHKENDPDFINNISESRRQTCLQAYGVDNPAKSETVKERVKESNRSRFGVDYPLQSDECLSKLRKTCNERYGVDYALESDEVQHKIKSTLLEIYGVDNPFKSDVVKAKIKQYYIDKYGVDWNTKVAEIMNKIQSSKVQEYGTTHLTLNYIYDSTHFDSSWELAYWVYCKDFGISIEHEPVELKYTYNGREHAYYPDFQVDGELIEIKGDQFFNEDGTMCNPFDHSQDGLFEAKHQCGLDNGVKFLREVDMIPVLSYIEDKYTLDYLSLFKMNLPFPYLNLDLKDTSDMGLIHHFHKSLYEASRLNKPSPLEAWNNKDLVKKSALNRIKYMGKCKPSDILQGFNVAKIAPKVSVFKPSLASELISKYLNQYSQIFDPFSGFSGRLLGAANTGKQYIGQDIHSGHVAESNDIISYKSIPNATVTVQDVLQSSGEYECLFTCPPYGGKEHWNKNNNEIEKSCDEWVTECLRRFKCKSYLFVVDKTDIYKDHIVETLSNKSHFGSNHEYVLLF